MKSARSYFIWMLIVCSALGPFLALGDEEVAPIITPWRRKLNPDDMKLRCQDFVSLHRRTEMNDQPMIDPFVRERFLYHWRKTVREHKPAQDMYEIYNWYIATVIPPKEVWEKPTPGSPVAREKYLSAESFDRLKIIERFLPFLRNGDDVDDLVSELYLVSHEALLKAWKRMNSAAGYAVAQSFRQSAMREAAIKYVWENLSQVTAEHDKLVKAFKATFMMKSPREEEHSPLERLMEANWVEHMSSTSIADLSMPESEPLPSHEAEILGKVIERRTLINAVRMVREKYLSEPFGNEQRWNVLEQFFWAEFNREEVEVKSLEEYGRRIGVSTERMRQLKVKLLQRVYKTYMNLVKGAWFASVNAPETGLEDND